MALPVDKFLLYHKFNSKEINKKIKKPFRLITYISCKTVIVLTNYKSIINNQKLLGYFDRRSFSFFL